jgi:alkylation response protein AidB-like acyl-CoA dehydrogenase
MERGHSVVSSGDVVTALDELMPFARTMRRIAETAAAVGSAERAVAAAKLTAAEAALANAKTCIQVHGGMGFTWEIDAHLYLKRAYALEPAFGTRDEWADVMADVLDQTA